MAAAGDEDSAGARGKPTDRRRKLRVPGFYKPFSSADDLQGKSPPGTSEEDAESFITASPGYDRDGDVTVEQRAWNGGWRRT
eukprot:6273404-Amphidinium_carterae.1